MQQTEPASMPPGAITGHLLAAPARIRGEAERRSGGLRRKVKLLRLCDLVQHPTLPPCQSLSSLVEADEAFLQAPDRIVLFVSHRWAARHAPDDGTLVERIFSFCLNAVVKNNFRDLPHSPDLHHSRNLCDRLNRLLAALDPAAVALQDPPSFHRFEGHLRALGPGPLPRIIRHVLGRIYLWIDFCCLPQAYERDGVVVERTAAEQREFLAGFEAMDALLRNLDCVIFWPASQITRAWLLYESLLSLPRGTASFHMPMQLIAPLSSLVRFHHRNFSELGAVGTEMMAKAFRDIGVTATDGTDIERIAWLMSSNLRGTEWNFRVIA